MNKNISNWIEGDGTVRTMFRKMSLWDYASQERSELQLLGAIEKGSALPSPFLVQYAIDRRIKEIQWISLYFPLLMLASPLLVAMYDGLITHNSMYLYLSMFLAVSLSVIFRITYYDQYLEACKYLYYAGDRILQEVHITAPGRAETSEWEEAQVIKQTNFTAVPAISEYIDVRKETLPLVESAETLLPESVLEKVKHLVGPEEENEMETEEEGSKNYRRGIIPLFLLDELIKKESGQPNVFNGDQHKNALFIAHITDCQPANILKKMAIYKKRENIQFATDQAQSTHTRYLAILIDHYLITENKILHKAAEDLQIFIQSIPVRKKR